jgi:UDP-N-acetyl-D-mannosaminuronate dehydrogenase
MPTATLSSTEAIPVTKHESRQRRNSTIIGVLGVGYVGKHLLDMFSSSFKTIGYDVSSTRVKSLQSESPLTSRIQFTDNEGDLKTATHFLIAVPTSLGLNGKPDFSHIIDATKIVERYARTGSIVVVESTVAVGTTRMLLEPLARCRKLFVGMCPEVRFKS